MGFKMQQLIPANEVRSEIIVLKSRFIATLTPVFTLEEAKSFIARIKGEYSNATHNVPAYLIGHGNSVIAHCSDDGEPSGTAGKPVLSVLIGSGLGDVAVVVTRYFGGRKLGTGGLVRAYSEVTKRVIEIVPRALKIPTYTVMMELPYSFYERVHSGIKDFYGEILEESFSSEVVISARFPVDNLSDFRAYVQNFSRGELNLLILEETESIIPSSRYKTDRND
jgi:uncharacterized YigZ family protein